MQNAKVNLPFDLHGRIASHFTQSAPSGVLMEFKGRRVSAQSLYGVLSLGIEKGDSVVFVAENKCDTNAVINLIQNMKKEEGETCLR